MSSPADRTENEIMMAPEIDEDITSNMTLHNPPAQLNNEPYNNDYDNGENTDNNNTSILKDKSFMKQKEEDSKNQDNDGIDEQKQKQKLQNNVLDTEDLIPLTQPISDNDSDENRGNTKNNGVESPHLASSTVIETEYRGQPVYSFTIDDIQIIKRVSDAKFNLTPILELIAKIDTENIDKFNNLKSYIVENYSKDENDDYWLSQDYIISILNDYNIKELLIPILTINLSPKINDRKRSNHNIFESPTKKHKVSDKSSNEFNNIVEFNKDLNIPIYNENLLNENSQFPHTLKPLPFNNSPINEHSKVIISSLFLPYQNEITLDQVLQNEYNFINSKTSENDNRNGDNQGKSHGNNDNHETGKLNNSNSNDNSKDILFDKNEINIDVPIDDNGQTALHLAATLGKVSLVKELIEKGANIFRGDNDGQTALIRVVHATNCFELSCFDKLLDLLYPTIKLLDNRDRTILHHIALNCGLKGRYDSTKYYLETLLEWVVKKGLKLSIDTKFSLNLTKFIGDVVNKSDKYGNNCLNYASLSGNKYIVSQLLEICADPDKANKIGVTPKDWGIDVNNNNGILTNSIIKKEIENISKNSSILKSTIDSEKNEKNDYNKVSNSNDNNNNNNNSGSGNTNNGIENNNITNNTEKSEKDDKMKEFSNSFQIINSIQSYISNISEEFKHELSDKSQQIEKLNPILREKTLQLSQKRKQFDELQKMIRKISKITNKIDNLNKAINEEEVKFQQEAKILNIEVENNNCLGNFDADQPFTILSMYQDVEEIVQKLLTDKINANKIKNGNDKNNDNNDTEDNNISSDLIIQSLNDIKASDILPLYEEKLTDSKKEIIKEEIPPTVVLDARIRAYEKNNQILMDRRKKKRDSNKELENQFKRIIGLCIGTETNEVDDKLLSSLLMSVENDPDPEIGQIKKVLKIVGDLDQDSITGSPARNGDLNRNVDGNDDTKDK